MKTRAAVALEQGGDLHIVEVDLADPGPSEVRVRIEACGICRSDLHAIDGGEDVHFPAVLGHEAAGIVDAVGTSVRSVEEGQRVVLSWTPACGTCPSCQRQQVHLCRDVTMSAAGRGPLTLNGQALDRFMALGAFCEHVVVPESMAIPIGRNIPAELACLLGCAVMTGFGAAAKTAAVRWGETVAVIGCGGVGLAAIQGARIAGAATVLAVDPIEERRQAALRVGATETFDASDTVKAILSRSKGGVDAAIECVGKTETMSQAFKMLRPGGRAVVVGLPGLTERLEIPAVLLLQERSLTGSMYGSANPEVDFPQLAELYEQGRLDLAALVGRTLPFDKINEGIVETRRGGATRVVLTYE